MMRSYVPDLPRFAAVCESNYQRLERLRRLGDEEGRDIVFDLHDGQSHRGSVRLRRLEQARYTETWYLEQLSESGQWLNDPHMTVRSYHDAAMSEVMSCYRHGRIQAVNPYPNANMHHPDEKLQVNLFLADWLDFCLKFGQLSNTSGVWSLESP